MLAISSASAQSDLFWDVNGGTAGTGGTGNWNAANTWRDGSDTGTLGNWADGNDAHFGGTAGTVTINSSVTARSLVFDTAGYTIARASANTLTINGNSADHGFFVNQNATISSVIAGTDGLMKRGIGVLILSGGNTYTGGTTIHSGIVRLGGATALGASSGAVSVASGAVLDMNGVNVANTNALTLNGPGIGGTGALLNSSTSANGIYTGAISLAGATTIGNTGTFRMQINSYLATNGHTLSFKGTSAGMIIFSPPASGITGSGSVVVDGAYLRLVDGGGNISTSNYTGTTTVINGGVILYFNNNIGTGNISLNGGTLAGYASAGFTRPFGAGSGPVPDYGW